MSQSRKYVIPGTVALFFGLALFPPTREAFALAGTSLVYQLDQMLFSVGLYF